MGLPLPVIIEFNITKIAKKANPKVRIDKAGAAGKNGVEYNKLMRFFAVALTKKVMGKRRMKM